MNSYAPGGAGPQPYQQPQTPPVNYGQFGQSQQPLPPPPNYGQYGQSQQPPALPSTYGLQGQSQQQQPPLPHYGLHGQGQPQQPQHPPNYGQHGNDQSPYYQQQFASAPQYPTPMSAPQDIPRRQSNPQATSQTCYNCGSPEHWAQDCPEPRRAVPAGALNNPRPLKRQKTTGPVITRYPPPPQYNQQRGPNRGFTHPPFGHQNPSQPPGQCGPPTPVSANGQPYNYWQQPSPQQYSPHSYQGQRHPSFGSQGLPTPASSYGSQFPSPVSSQSALQQQSFFPPHGQYQQPPYQPYSGGSHRSSEQWSRHSSMASEQPLPIENDQSMGPSRQQSMSSDQIPASTSGLEPWMEELQSLDIPENKTGSGQIIWRPANPVARPLPSTLEEADLIGQLPIAATLAPGMSVSKYFPGKDDISTEHNIRDTEHWPPLQHDPVFLEVPLECKVVSVEELISRRTQLSEHVDNVPMDAEEGEVDQDAAEIGEVDESGDYQYAGYSSVPDSQEHAVPEAFHEPPAQAPPHLEETPEERAAREQEERLAALGVTGPPKPVRAPARPYVAGPEIAKPATESEGNATRDRSKSPGRRHSESQGQVSDELTNSRNGYRDRENYPARYSPPNSRSSGDRNLTDPHISPPHDRYRRMSASRSYDRSIPSPPPSRKRSKYLDGADDGSPTESRGQDQNTNGNGSAEPSNGNHESLSNGHGESLIKTHSDRSNPRKRPHRLRDDSEERDDGPKRQEDDITPKIKRRQPQVADAYSRRW